MRAGVVGMGLRIWYIRSTRVGLYDGMGWDGGDNGDVDGDAMQRNAKQCDTAMAIATRCDALRHDAM